ncbi:MAG TPA: sulfatase-like hydrolase/transferase [Thermoanaerobaculia bacterium]|nr:sulfatase-like hydrolase/transferase [Thermoanaerobaculia bacterium]
MPKRTRTAAPRRRPERQRVVLLAAAAVVTAALLGWWGIRAGERTPTRPANDPDILLITIDTLRADALGFAGNKDVHTPLFDRLAGEGVVFTNAHAHNVVTLPSHANIITGLYPYQHGIRDNAGFVLGGEHRTLAEVLKERGYATGAFVGAFPLDARFGLGRGFDVYDDRYREGKAPTQFVMAERPANEVLDAARSWYETTAGKKFLWVHLYDPHAPYQPPPPFQSEYRDRPYLGEVAFTDAQLGRFLEPLLSRPDPPFVVLTSDHGESLGEHGELTHGLFAYEATLKVPLILHERGRLKRGLEHRAVRHVDIFPTILDRLGLPVPDELPGRSLLRMEGDRDTYFESLTASLNRGWAPLVGMIHQGHKYVDLPLPELYDLPSDPEEERNLAGQNRRMLFRIRELLAGSAPAALEVKRKVSSEERSQLLSLGYFVGEAPKKSYTERDDPKNLVHLDAQMQEIISLYGRGETGQAIDVAREILGERSDMTIVREMLSFLYQQNEMPAAAIATLREAIGAGYGSEALQRRLGLVLSESGHAEEAVKVLARFNDAEDPELLNAYGIALADAGKGQEAIRQFERVLQIDRTNATAYQNLGIVALRAGDLRRAHDYLSRGLALNDQMPIALNTLGVVHARSGDAGQAIEMWRRAVALDPTLYDALYNLSVVAQKEGEVEIARQALKQFIETAPPERYAADVTTARQMLARLDRRPS